VRHKIKTLDPRRASRAVLIDAYIKMRDTLMSYRIAIHKMRKTRKGLKERVTNRAYQHYNFIYKARFKNYKKEQQRRARVQVKKRANKRVAKIKRRVFVTRASTRFREVGLYGMLLFILAKRTQIRGTYLSFFIWAGEFEMFDYKTFKIQLRKYGPSRFTITIKYLINLGLVYRVNEFGTSKIYALTADGRALHDKIRRFLRNHAILKTTELRKQIEFKKHAD